MIGYRAKLKRDQANIVALAYQTAAFNNMKNKPKPLSHYVDKVLNFGKNRKPKDGAIKQLQWAKEMDQKIEEAKRRKEAELDAG